MALKGCGGCVSASDCTRRGGDYVVWANVMPVGTTTGALGVMVALKLMPVLALVAL